MRVNQAEVDFAKWILTVGDGTAKKVNSDSLRYSGEDHIFVDETLLLLTENEPITAIGNHVYNSFEENYTKIHYLQERSILSPRNDTVDVINAKMLNWVPGKSQTFFSVDSISANEYVGPGLDDGVDYSFQYPIEYLNAMSFSNFPHHKLCLKVNSPVMLIRNICQRDGLCNGTQMVITRLGSRVIQAKIIT